MEFSNRNVQQQPASTPTAAPGTTGGSGSSRRSKADKGKWSRIGAVAFLIAIVALIVGIATLAASGPKAEVKYVDSSKLQAVFLNTGQVYFGNIKALNNKYFVVSNIYYLQTSNANGTSSAASSSTANTNVTLVKLGCELHEPYDQMVINSDQVTFWENLQDNGQVAKAVATFEKQNPNGQKCADQSTSSSSNSSNSVQSAGNSSTPASTTPSTTTPATKP
jgi:hypothetical protein